MEIVWKVEGVLEDRPSGRLGDIITASNRSSDSNEGLLELRLGKIRTEGWYKKKKDNTIATMRAINKTQL